MLFSTILLQRRLSSAPASFTIVAMAIAKKKISISPGMMTFATRRLYSSSSTSKDNNNTSNNNNTSGRNAYDASVEIPKELLREIQSTRPKPMRGEFFGDEHKITREKLEELHIGVTNHYKPQGFSDRFAYGLVRTLRLLPDMYFRNDHYMRVVMLETIAAVPGMIGAMLRHMRALNKLKMDQGSWITHLLHEAENERMHLMIFLKLLQPNWFNRWLILIAQGVFFNSYFWLYFWSPRTAHRMCGYLEEEAIHSYTEFIEALENGTLDNPQAPKMAIEYYNLVPNATVLDVALCVRADEAVHRDANHYLSTCITRNLPIFHEENTP